MPGAVHAVLNGDRAKVAVGADGHGNGQRPRRRDGNGNGHAGGDEPRRERAAQMEAAQPTGSAPERAHVLVVPNETVAGHKVLEAIEHRAAHGPIRVHRRVPAEQAPARLRDLRRHRPVGRRVRLELILGRLKELGIEARGEVMDPDPFLATQDAIREWGADEIIISTYPYPRSGLLRRDLVERIQKWSRLPVEHVEVDLREEPMRHALVVANQTIGGRPLIESLERRSTETPHRFTVIAPQSGGDDGAAGTQERLDQTLRELRHAGLDVSGYVTHPDPLTAIVNALQFDPADEIVISTLPSYRSHWLRGDLINQARRATGLPVEHLVFDPDAEREPTASRSCLMESAASLTTPTRSMVRPRRTRARVSIHASSACCFSSSRRRCCSARSSRCISSSASCRTRPGRRSRSSSRSRSPA